MQWFRMSTSQREDPRTISTLWHRLTLRFRHNTHSANAQLAAAYRDVLTGRPTQQQQQIVLADLMARSGFNKVTPPSASDRDLWFAEGRRSLFGEIFSHLSLSDRDMDALNNAARIEAAHMNQEGITD